MKILAIALITIAVIIGGFLLLTKGAEEKVEKSRETITTTETTSEKELQATFGIFTNLTFRVFSDAKYLNQSAEVYMDSANIVTVKKEGTTWDDFFKTLPMELTKECLTTGTGQVFCSGDKEKLRFFINGGEDPDALDKVIKKDDELLVSFGDKSDEEIQSEIDRVSSL
jgi:hypothetical protein